MAGAARKKKNNWTYGQLIQGYTWTEMAKTLVQADLGIPTFVLETPGEDFFPGMKRDENGDLWQDEAACRSYTENGVEYNKKGGLALWCSAVHLTTTGAEEHFALLVKALQREFPDLVTQTEELVAV